MKLNPEQKAGIEKEVSFITSRSGGPGGQNVNKVETRVQLRWNLAETGWIPATIKSRIAEIAKNRLSQDKTILTIQSNRFRSQLKNKEMVLNLLYTLIEDAMIPVEDRLPTRPTASARVRRLEGKKQRSVIKSHRKPILDNGED